MFWVSQVWWFQIVIIWASLLWHENHFSTAGAPWYIIIRAQWCSCDTLTLMCMSSAAETLRVGVVGASSTGLEWKNKLQACKPQRNPHSRRHTNMDQKSDELCCWGLWFSVSRSEKSEDSRRSKKRQTGRDEEEKKKETGSGRRVERWGRGEDLTVETLLTPPFLLPSCPL